MNATWGDNGGQDWLSAFHVELTAQQTQVWDAVITMALVIAILSAVVFVALKYFR